MAVLGTLNFCMGVEILNTNSDPSFEACVVGSQKNRLIEMAALSTLNFCMCVEILNTNIYRSFEACVVGDQKNRLIEMDVLSTPNFGLGVEILKTRFLSIFRGLCCWCSKQSSHRDSCFEYPKLLLG